jgi:hypothetical protein
MYLGFTTGRKQVREVTWEDFRGENHLEPDHTNLTAIPSIFPPSNSLIGQVGSK